MAKKIKIPITIIGTYANGLRLSLCHAIADKEPDGTYFFLLKNIGRKIKKKSVGLGMLRVTCCWFCVHFKTNCLFF